MAAHLNSFAHACTASLALLAGALTCVPGGAAHAAAAGAAQRDPELGAVVQQAINQAECFTDQFDSAVWYKLMEPKLRSYLKDRDERLTFLTTVWCETRRAQAAPLPPGLVLALVEVESRFDRWAVSSAGAVGLMQVMPFWPEKLGMRRRQLNNVEANVRMGCAILRFYMQRENNDIHRALARYNGSSGTRVYSNRVVDRWTRVWSGADDLARTARKSS